MKIKIIKFNKDIQVPVRAHYDDAGLDVFAPFDFALEPGQETVISLGFGVDLPNGYMMSIRPRSSINIKGIHTFLGTIDAGYKGEIKAAFLNFSNFATHNFKKGDKICQLIVEPVAICELVEDLGEERETGGFGSTGR